MSEAEYDGTLKFRADHIGNLIVRHKDTTIRPTVEAAGLEEGDVVELQSAAGISFGEAKVSDVDVMTSEAIVEVEFSGHRNYDRFSEFASEMKQYYPEMYVAPTTEWAVIRFRSVRLKGGWG